MSSRHAFSVENAVLRPFAKGDYLVENDELAARVLSVDRAPLLHTEPQDNVRVGHVKQADKNSDKSVP